MHKILMVIRREYLESVRKKVFWIGTAAFPLFIVGIFALQIVASMVTTDEQKTIAIMDENGAIAAPLEEALLIGDRLKTGEPKYPVEIIDAGIGLEDRRTEALQRVEAGELYALISIGSSLTEDGFARLDWKNAGDQRTFRDLRNALYDVVVQARFDQSELQIEAEKLKQLTASVQLESFQITKGGESTKKGFEATFLPVMVFVMMLYFLIYFHGYTVTRGIVAEKSTRVMEILLGSLSPTELMTGKIIGLGLVGLTQVSIYVISGAIFRIAARIWLSMGDLDFLLDALAIDNLLAFAVFYLFGYFLFVTIFAMIGAACNTDMEAQQLQAPVVICLMLPMMTTFFFVANPDSTLATVLSMIPISRLGEDLSHRNVDVRQATDDQRANALGSRVTFPTRG
jgi:ABC-2 type transport system permease protein